MSDAEDPDDRDDMPVGEEYEPPDEAPFEAEPADAAEQSRDVPVGDDEYAPE